MGNDPSAVITAIVVIALLALIMRWVFRPSRKRPIVRPPDATESGDLGLLAVVLTGLSRSEALARRATLGEAQIRSSLSKRRDGRLDLLVFRNDIERARALLGP
ncbi:hypothetical protein [uncultured Jatrophihabitans sp.]|uniref:hypothetical protein n=1 Tax=uncultured Jatrophihabitans sp. TaxID=1610747 RepID=UPI0035CC71B4